jgi:tight adherence protein B
MWMLPVTFVLTFAVIFGVYWALVVRPEQGARVDMSKRLSASKVGRKSVNEMIVRGAPRVSSIPAFESLLGRTGSVPARIQELLDGADVQMSVGRFLLSSLLLGLSVYVLIVFTLNQMGTGIFLGFIAAWLPTFYVRRLRTVRYRKFEEQFPEAIELIARALRAGHGLTAGIGMVADEVPNPMGREFRQLYEWQNFGMPFHEAMTKFAERVPLLDSRFFVTAVLTQREAGGNLAEVLDNLGRVIRDRFRVKRQIRVLSAHGRITGAVLSGLPPALALYFFATRPDYITELASDPMGVRMVFAALTLQLTGMLIIRRLVDIEY